MIKIVRCRWKVDFRSYFHPLMFSNPILVLEKEAVVTRLPSYAKEREAEGESPQNLLCHPLCRGNIEDE